MSYMSMRQHSQLLFALREPGNAQAVQLRWQLAGDLQVSLCMVQLVHAYKNQYLSSVKALTLSSIENSYKK